MGRPKKSVPADIEPEDESQEDREEGPARALESSGSVNQAELVRKAAVAGHEEPATGVPYIKTQFGVDIDPKYYSVAKSQLKKREAKSSFAPEPAKRGRKPKAAEPVARKPLVEGYVAPPEKPKAAGDSDILLALEGVKELVSQFGPDRVKKMVDLLS
jgi:hypothetical protein